jgi:hypothetical protein
VIDDDVTVDRHWLLELMAGFRVAPQVACVTGAILPRELDTEPQILIERYGGFHKGFDEVDHGLEAQARGNPLHPFNAGTFGSGGNVAYRRSALETTGAYDPLLGNGTPTRSGEDFELFLRIVRRGHRLIYRPSAVVRHLHRRDRAALDEVIAGYGVGLGALFTRTVVREPHSALEIAQRLPQALRYLLSSSSPKNAHMADGYPVALRLAEVKGLLAGPPAYARSAFTARWSRGGR